MRGGLGGGLELGEGESGLEGFGAEAIDAAGNALDGEAFSARAAEPDVDVAIVGTDAGGDLWDADSAFSGGLEQLDDLAGHFAAAGAAGKRGLCARFFREGF